jgi:hypothetical protein
MGTGQASHLVNVIDFGLAKKFKDHDGAHIPYKQDAHHGVGTSLFASINTHHGIGRFCFSHCFRIGHTYANLCPLQRLRHVMTSSHCPTCSSTFYAALFPGGS